MTTVTQIRHCRLSQCLNSPKILNEKASDRWNTTSARRTCHWRTMAKETSFWSRICPMRAGFPQHLLLPSSVYVCTPLTWLSSSQHYRTLQRWSWLLMAAWWERGTIGSNIFRRQLTSCWMGTLLYFSMFLTLNTMEAKSVSGPSTCVLPLSCNVVYPSRGGSYIICSYGVFAQVCDSGLNVSHTELSYIPNPG